MTARPHPPEDVEVMRNNESHWSGLTLLIKDVLVLIQLVACHILSAEGVNVRSKIAEFLGT